EKDLSARLRRAVKENNLFLVKRLVQRTDLRNPDPSPMRYTSLAWAAILGHEETFEFLLNAGHDDQELTKDAENNTILLLLADIKPVRGNTYTPADSEISGAALRMTRMYFDHFPYTLDWANSSGKTAVHVAALRGKEDLVRMLCDLGADIDLPDNEGNTPLHHASAWGHIPIVQLLIERGCHHHQKNTAGFTPSDYAYSLSTRETLQDSARIQYELNKKARVFKQAAQRGTEWSGGGSTPRSRNATGIRSGSVVDHDDASGSESELESVLSVVPFKSRLNPLSSSILHPYGLSSSSSPFFQSSPAYRNGTTVHPAIVNPTSVLTPIATRTLLQDANAMEKYMRRNRSGSASTDMKSQYSSNPSSAGPSADGDDISSLPLTGSVAPRRKLRPSVSANQLRSSKNTSPSTPEGARHRSGTNPIGIRANPPTFSPPLDSRALPPPIPSRGHSRSNGVPPPGQLVEEPGSFTGPPSEYAKFPAPPPSKDSLTANGVPLAQTTPTSTRRLPFNLLSKPLPSIEQAAGHRRGSSNHSV
ncbi:ankyrin repeat-containing domain protein, partial [Vararia minispora EC-137]